MKSDGQLYFIMALNISPLRYPGGKAILSSFIEDIINVNNYNKMIYVEPFAGGASIALYLLFNKKVNKIYLNDIDKHIYAFWNSILNDTEAFINKIKEQRISIAEWKKQKQIYEHIEDFSDFEVGFSTFFLNRCNHSGILTGSPIGGFNQNGKWKIDSRFNKIDLIRRIKNISLYKDNIFLFNLDAEIFIKKKVKQKKGEQIFIYIDPPYYPNGNRLYYNYYKQDEHIKLSYFIRNLAYKWILSYNNVPEIYGMYPNIKYIFMDIHYSANKKRKNKELIFFSPNIFLPDRVSKEIKI